KLMNLPHLALLHPSVAPAELGDPLAIARETGEQLPLERERLLEVGTGRIQQCPDALEVPVQDTKGPTAGWDGVAPYLRDGARGLEDRGLHGSGEGADGEDESINRCRDHVDFALAPDWEVLGAPPEDLAAVLAQVAIAAPGVCALRAVGRAAGGERSYADVHVRRAAHEISTGLRSLLNRPETMAAVRAATGARAEE